MSEVDAAWYKSKKLVALVANHTIVLVVSVFGIVKNPASTGQIIVGAFAEMGPVTAAHSVSQGYVDGAQAKSPYYAPPGQPYPPIQPMGGGANPLPPTTPPVGTPRIP